MIVLILQKVNQYVITKAMALGKYKELCKRPKQKWPSLKYLTRGAPR